MKLANIDPIQLAREVVSAAVDHIYSAAMAIDIHLRVRIDREEEPWDPHAEWPLPKDGVGVWGAPESTTLGHAVLCLTHYAKTGAPLDASVHEYCVTLIGAAGDALDDSAQPDPSTPLGLVVSAALAREDLEHGRAVSTTRLAALGGVADSRVRQLVSAGDLAVTSRDGSNYVHASDAKRWLGARGVAGL